MTRRIIQVLGSLSLAAAFVLGAPEARAGTTGKLAGRVVNEKKEPLMGANVRIDAMRMGAASDENGEYFIIGLPAGTYAVRVNLLGHAAYLADNVVIRPDFTTSLDVVLRTEAVQLGEVRVEAERPLLQKDATGTTRFISSQDIQKLPTRGYRDAAAQQTGVVNFQRQIDNETSNGNTLIIRGGRPNETAYFVDGFSQQDPLTGSSSTAINNNAIEEVVVLTGGFAPEYGRIMSGAVNVVTREGSKTYKGAVEAVSDALAGKWAGTRRADYNLYDGSLGGPVIPGRDDLTFYVSGERRWQRDRAPSFIPDVLERELRSQGLQGDIKPNNSQGGYSLQGKLNWRLGDRASLKVGGLGSRDDWREYRNAYLFDLEHTPRYLDQNASYFATWNQTLSPKMFYSLGTNFFETERRRGDGVAFDDLNAYARSPNPRFDSESPMFWKSGHVWDDYLQRRSSYVGGQGSLVWQFDNHNQLKAGADFQRHTLRFFNHFAPSALLGDHPDLTDWDGYGYDLVVERDATGAVTSARIVENGDGSRDGPKHPKTFSLYTQDKYEREGLVVNGGLRFDYIDVDTPALRNDHFPLGDTLSDPGNLPDVLESRDLRAEQDLRAHLAAVRGGVPGRRADAAALQLRPVLPAAEPAGPVRVLSVPRLHGAAGAVLRGLRQSEPEARAHHRVRGRRRPADGRSRAARRDGVLQGREGPGRDHRGAFASEGVRELPQPRLRHRQGRGPRPDDAAGEPSGGEPVVQPVVRAGHRLGVEFAAQPGVGGDADPQADRAARLRPAAQAVGQPRLEPAARAGPAPEGAPSARANRTEPAVQRGERHAVHAHPGVRRGHAGYGRHLAVGLDQLALRPVDLEPRPQGDPRLHAQRDRLRGVRDRAQRVRRPQRDPGVHVDRVADQHRLPRHARRAGLPADCGGRRARRRGAVRPGAERPELLRQPTARAFRPADELLTMRPIERRPRMNIRRDIRTATLAALTLVTCVAPARAAAPARGRGAQPLHGQSTLHVTSFVGDRHLDINRFNMWVSNFGAFAGRQDAFLPGLVYPNGQSVNGVIYASGLWLGAKVNGEVRATVADYQQEYLPGPIVDGTPADPTGSAHVVYKMARFTGNPQDTAHVTRDAADESTDPLVHHSWSEYMSGAAPYGAPWKLYRLPDTSTPAEGDSVDVPGPDVLGDQMLWCVYNDADPAPHTDPPGNSLPLGVEIQQTTFAFDRLGALGTTAFMKFRIINKGTETLDQMYVSLWSDPDLGGASDDLVGSDTTLAMGYVYNSTNNDLNYGAVPPAVGFDFLRGPRVGAARLGLSSFNKYINNLDPQAPDETYNYMLGLKPDGSVLTDPRGVVTTFYNSGNPVTGTGWLDTNPADRRMMMSSGPFTMAPGDTQEVVAGIVLGQCGDRLSSIEAMKFNDRVAQAAFDSSFALPSPPPQPQVAVATDHGHVTLSWNEGSRLGYHDPRYAFQGYVVYQGETATGPWKRLATYDLADDVGRVRDDVFDAGSCSEFTDFVVAFGENTGLRFSYTATTDAVRGGPLLDATQYYYAVTAYSFFADGFPKVLENSPQVLAAIPQRAPGGTDYASTDPTAFTHARVDSALSPSTDVLDIQVVDPVQVTGHRYRVTFTPLSPPFPQVDGQDVLFGWDLTDVTTGDTLLKRQINKTGAGEYRVVDGLMVKVRGAYVPAFQDAGYLDEVATHAAGLGGVAGGGGPFFDGGGDSGFNFWGGALDPAVAPDSFGTVQLRFSRTATQQGYRFLRLQLDDGTAPDNGREYRYGGFHTVPFQVWDVSHGEQLDVAWVERTVADAAGTIQPPASQLATFDSTWAPNADEDGGGEYLFVLKRPYSDTPKAEFAADGAILADEMPILYALWARKPSGGAVVDDGDAFQWLWAQPATSNDIYEFTTHALVRNDAGLAKANLKRIRVVPNPYYAHSAYELSPFARVVRFINLPEHATVRIFNLAGDLVRTLEKTDATTSILEWDLQTRNRLPVGSGVYVFHVDAPGVGSTFGRIAVFMEKERLTTY